MAEAEPCHREALHIGPPIPTRSQPRRRSPGTGTAGGGALPPRAGAPPEREHGQQSISASRQGMRAPRRGDRPLRRGAVSPARTGRRADQSRSGAERPGPPAGSPGHLSTRSRPESGVAGGALEQLPRAALEGRLRTGLARVRMALGLGDREAREGEKAAVRPAGMAGGALPGQRVFCSSRSRAMATPSSSPATCPCSPGAARR
jgi:hypothetical protein